MKRQHTLNFDVVVVFALLFLFSILTIAIVAMGSQLYQKTVVSVQDSYESQTSLSYVANKLRYLGRANAKVEALEVGPALLITETIDDTEYQTVIYYYDGYLCETFLQQGQSFTPAYGERIMELASFSIRQNGSLLYFDVETTNGDRDTLTISLEGGTQ